MEETKIEEVTPEVVATPVESTPEITETPEEKPEEVIVPTEDVV